MEPVGIFALIVAFQLFFMAIFLFFHYRRTAGSSIYLGICFLILGVNMLGILAQTVEAISLSLFWHLFDDCLLLLLGPLLLIFTKSMVYKNFKLGAATAYHAIPFLFFALSVFGMFYGSDTVRGRVAAVQPESSVVAVRLIITLFYIHALIYMWRSKKILHSYDQLLKEHFSNLGKVKIKSMHLVLNTFLLLGIVGAVQLQIPNSLNTLYTQIFGLALIMILFVFVYRSMYLAIKGSGWIKELFFEDLEKYATSTLEDDERKELAGRLTTEMEEKELFLEPDLTIGQLAGRLGTGTKQLSQVINQTFDKNFFDYVNTYRIERACKLLGDSENHMTIQEIMYQVGFSSKSSFNTLFKKKTGKTPSDFRHSTGIDQ